MKACKFVMILASLSISAGCAADARPNTAGLSETDWKQIGAAYDVAAHGFSADEKGTFHARNPKQQWLANFDGRGFNLIPDHGEWSWGLRLNGFSGNKTSPLSRTTPTNGIRHEGTRLEYRWNANFTEWFLNDGRGLEHGWTFHEKPEGDGNLVLQFDITGNLSPIVEETEVKFQAANGSTSLTYSGLKAWDADGVPLGVRFSRDGGTLLSILVDAHHARFPVTVDPIAQQAYLKASNTGKGDHFGTAVAVSGDTVAVSAPEEGGYHGGVNGNQDNDKSLDVGAVYVFKRSGTTWIQEAYIKDSQPLVETGFGSSLALSGDLLAVGLPGSLSRPGAVAVFERHNGVWGKTATLSDPIPKNSDFFGRALAASDDRIVVGKVEIGLFGIPSGYSDAYVFSKNNGTWMLETTLISDTGLCGWHVATDGELVVVGAPGSDLPGKAGTYIYDGGSAYIFERTNHVWTNTGTLIPQSPDNHDEFGTSVAVSGSLVIVGSPGEDSDSSGINGNQTNNRNKESGAAYAFSKQGATWVLDAYLKPSNNDRSHQFGCSVCISGDRAVIGSSGENNWSTGVNGPQNVDWDYAFGTFGDSSGAAYLFTRAAGTWSQTAYLKASNTKALDRFGSSVAISGSLIVVGSPFQDGAFKGINPQQTIDKYSFDSGAAYVFDLNSPPAPEIWVSAPDGKMMVTGDTADFGDTTWLGATSTRNLVIRNRGFAALKNIRFGFSGVDAAEFTIGGKVAQTLAAGQKMTVPIVFEPKGIWDRHAMLEIFSNDNDENPFLVELEGYGESREPEIRVYQPSKTPLTDGRSKTSFGTVKVGKTGNAKTYEIHNTGYSKLSGLKPVISGAAAADFAILSMPAMSVKAGDETRFRIAFKPTLKGTRNAILKIPNNDRDENPFTVKLTGMGAK